MGERTVFIDCDVIQADGGTRTASITGAFVALALAFERMTAAGIWRSSPLIDTVAATSVGIVEDKALLDLAYEEDSRAEVDMNVVMTGSGHFVEIQATAEGRPFAGSEMQDLARARRRRNPPPQRRATNRPPCEVQCALPLSCTSLHRIQESWTNSAPSPTGRDVQRPLYGSGSVLPRRRVPIARPKSNSRSSRVSPRCRSLKRTLRHSPKTRSVKRCTIRNSGPNRAAASTGCIRLRR